MPLSCEACGKDTDKLTRGRCRSCYQKYRRSPEFELVGYSSKNLSHEDRRNEIRRANIRRLYGIELEEYERRFKEANGRCQLCGCEAKRLVLEHCHKTGRVRGIVCNPCNQFLERVDNAPEVLQRLEMYLRG